MPNITNYSPLIQSMFGGKRTSWGTESTLPGVFQFSQLNSSSIQSQLKAAGIDTSSKRYKAVIEQMKKSGCTGNKFTNVQAIKNLMKNYNSRGEFVDPNTGLTGLDVTDETGDRLSAGYTLQKYHSAYAQAFISAIKEVDPTWEYGKAIPSGALDGITRESIESALVQKGNTFANKTVDYYV